MLIIKESSSKVQGDPVLLEALAFRWVITLMSKKLTAPLRERYYAILPNLLPPNMGKLFFISSSKARLLMEDSGVNTCSLTPSVWIMAIETAGVKKKDCLFSLIKTGGIYQNAVWFSSRKPHLSSLESPPLSILFLLISYSLTHFLVST